MSERDLRKCKNREKSSGGFRTAKGKELYCKILSIIETCRRKGKCFIEQIQTNTKSDSNPTNRIFRPEAYQTLKRWHYSLSLQIFPFSHILNHKFCLHENENQLHWSLDVVFKEDAQLIRKDNAPLNMIVCEK